MSALGNNGYRRTKAATTAEKSETGWAKYSGSAGAWKGIEQDRNAIVLMR